MGALEHDHRRPGIGGTGRRAQSAETDAERDLQTLLDRSDGERPWQIRDELAQTMHENFGVFRREDQMLRQGQIVAGLRERYERVVVDDKGEIFNNDLTQALELGFLLELADCMVVAGIARKESRGEHSRPYDFPERDDISFLKHTLVRLDDDGRPQLGWKPVTMKFGTAAVVGSAIVELIERSPGNEAASVAQFIKQLSAVSYQPSAKTSHTLRVAGAD